MKNQVKQKFMTTLDAGTIIYRADNYECKTPRINYCKDTGKIGAYFSIWHPYLSETMCLEYKRDMVVSIYRFKEKYVVQSNGKYGYREDPLSIAAAVLPQDNISHIDYEIGAINILVEEPRQQHAELFLPYQDIAKIEFLASYTITQEQCLKLYSVVK